MLLSRQCLFSRTGLATLLTLGIGATVLTALGFEHIGGYMPCALCLMQRTPYYIGAPIGALAALASWFGAPAWLSRGLLLLVGVIMLVSAGLGIYHAGVEWHFWAGPAGCSGAITSQSMMSGNLLDDLNSITPPSCSDAPLRVLGLSFAGWNVLSSLFLAAIAFAGARRPSRHQG